MPKVKCESVSCLSNKAGLCKAKVIELCDDGEYGIYCTSSDYPPVKIKKPRKLVSAQKRFKLKDPARG